MSHYAISSLKRWTCAGLAALGIVCAPAFARTTLDPSSGERRVALVIGNSAYKFSPLKNSANDARAMADAFTELGFEVTLKEDTDTHALFEMIRSFAIKAKDSDVRVLYYAGHGMQVKGKNYLVPVDAQIGGEDEVPAKAADVNELLDRLGQLTSGLSIVILDACRINPFVNSATVGSDGRLIKFRGVARPGLAQIDAPQGTLVAFSTAPNAAAIDYRASQNGLYTKHLLNNIGIPGLPVEKLFKRVRLAVAQDSERYQVPWESSSLIGDFCFKTSPHGKCGGYEESLIDASRLAPR